MHPVDRLRETRLLPVIVGLAIVAVALLLSRITHVLPPFFWAAITAYLLYPLVVRLERGLHLPRALVILGLYVILIGLLVIVGVLLLPTVFTQAREFATSLPDLIASARQELVKEPEIRFAGFVFDTREIDRRIDLVAQQIAERFGREAVPLFLHTIEVAIKVLVWLLATFYFLLQGDVVLRKIRGLAPPRHRKTVERVTAQVNETFGAYIRAQILLFVIMSVATFILLTVLQIEYALVLAIMTGALELIPIIGPWSAGIIAVLVTLAQGEGSFGWSPVQLAAVVGLSYFLLRMTEDHLVIPQLVGRIVRLHPVLIVFGVLGAASIGGLLGLVLVVPVLAVLKIVTLAVVEELRHPPERHVIALREPGALREFASELARYEHQHVVLLIAPGAIGWDDLVPLQTVAAEALALDIRLQVVTPDRIAASLATATGIEVVTRAQFTEDLVQPPIVHPEPTDAGFQVPLEPAEPGRVATRIVAQTAASENAND